jgi:quercetin dioxygenase-like cupin family protein
MIMVIRGSQYKEFELMGNHMLGLATLMRGANEVAVWRGRTEPGATTPRHYHDHEEVIVILSGTGKVRIEADEVSISSGDVAILPPLRHHELAADERGEGLDAIAVLPAGTKTYRPNGEELELPWAQ